MPTRRGRRRLDCEALEVRSCPSATFAPPPSLPASAVPAERTDALASGLHAQFSQQAASITPNVLFLGDSITYYFRYGSGDAVWQKQIAPLGAADFGVPSDMTQNILWRIEHGELVDHPPVVVLMAGTNNLVSGKDSIEETSEGIAAIVQEVRQLSPQSKILLMGLLPRGPADDPDRAQIQQVNASISTLADDVHVFYMDPGASMVAPDGSIAADFLPDLTHPNAAGYELWAEQLVGPIEALLGASTASTRPAPAPLATTPLAVTASGLPLPPWT